MEKENKPKKYLSTNLAEDGREIEEETDEEIAKNIVDNALRMAKEKEFKLDEKIMNGKEEWGWVHYTDIKEFIKRRIMESTRLLALFNQGKLTSIDLREHRQRIKDDAGNKLIES